MPRQLSGGQRQRVAMGRAIVRDPKVFLFDEPLSNLDAKLRVQMRTEIKRLRERVAMTTIYVTHDQVEAMTLADRIVILNVGRIEQIGTPEEVYDTPATVFVAGFIGAPPMNLLPARLGGDGRDRRSATASAVALPAGPCPARRPGAGARRRSGPSTSYRPARPRGDRGGKATWSSRWARTRWSPWTSPAPADRAAAAAARAPRGRARRARRRPVHPACLRPGDGASPLSPPTTGKGGMMKRRQLLTTAAAAAVAAAFRAPAIRPDAAEDSPS